MRAFFLSFLSVLLTQAAEGPARTFSARDLFGLRVASDPQFRPVGGAIAYVRITYDISTDQGQPTIWLVDPNTGVQSPLVIDESANFAPRWSPDGQRIAYVSSSPGRSLAALPSQSAQKAQAILGWFARYSSNEK